MVQAPAHGRHGRRGSGASLRASALGLGSALSPEAEEVRREIRALKGLVLNRRSFMPSMGRRALSAEGTATPVEAAS